MVLGGNFMAIQVFMKKREKSQIKKSNLTAKVTRKRRTNKAQVSRRKKVIKTRVEINEREIKKRIKNQLN